jgi:uncharacterized protein (TIGR02217 family)
MSGIGFDDVLFPVGVALGASGGPERRTEIVALGSGRESRNARWYASRRRWDAGTGLKTLDDIAAVVAFFEARRGRLIGFRWRDGLDDRSSSPSALPTALDQTLGVGDGVTASFQLIKRYGGGDGAYLRTIAKPVAGSVVVAVAGAAVAEGDGFDVDTATGVVAFRPGFVPAAGAAVSAGYRFHVPVRFDTDQLRVDLAAFAAGEVPSVPVVEIVP